MKRADRFITSPLLLCAVLVGLFVSYRKADAAPLPLLNPGFEEAGSTSRVANGWQSFGNGYQRVSQPHSGQWSVRLRNASFAAQSGAYQRVYLNQASLKPVFIGAYVKGASIVNAPGGYLGASLYAEIHLQDGSVVYWNSIANYGTFSWRWVGFNTGSLPTVNKPISHIFIVPILGNAKGTAHFDDISVTEFDPSQAAVTLMFDDGEETALTKAKPVLDGRGFSASIAMVTEMIDEPGFLTAQQLRNLQGGGWEIVSHTVTHSDLTTLSSSQIRNELSQSKQALQSIGLQVRNFALPFGAYNAFILAEASRYYVSARAFEQGNNPQGTFPFDVKVRGVVNATTPDDVAAWVSDALANNRWLVLVFHVIAESGDDAYHTKPATFARMVDAIAAAGIQVKTYDQALRLFGVGVGALIEANDDGGAGIPPGRRFPPVFFPDPS